MSPAGGGFRGWIMNKMKNEGDRDIRSDDENTACHQDAALNILYFLCVKESSKENLRNRNARINPLRARPPISMHGSFIESDRFVCLHRDRNPSIDSFPTRIRRRFRLPAHLILLEAVRIMETGRVIRKLPPQT